MLGFEINSHLMVSSALTIALRVAKHTARLVALLFCATDGDVFKGIFELLLSSGSLMLI